MALSEATRLAANFITSIVFKVHGLPLDDRGANAELWWRQQASRIPRRPALEEHRRHLSLFASRRRSDRRGQRQVFLTISAIVDDSGNGRCPMLTDRRCAIYDTRPLTCRTVPLHYSRPPSALRGYLDKFTSTPGYECDTTAAPIVLNGNHVVSPTLAGYRDEAIAVAKADRAWAARILAMMDDAQLAKSAGLPTYDDVVTNAANGYATSLPMIAAWRIATGLRVLSTDALRELCSKQIVLIDAELARLPKDQAFMDMRQLYQFEMERIDDAFQPLDTVSHLLDS